MIVPDVNLLLYAHMSQAAPHAQALEWWESAMNSDQTIGLTWVTILGFLRLSTKRAVYDKPLSITQAEVNVRDWMAQPNVRILEPGNRHTDILFDLLRELGTAGNLTTDAHIAALALEWNATVYSADGDFGRWPQVRWVNPLAQ